MSEIIEIDGKNYISVYDLRKLGFGYPPKGTTGLYLETVYLWHKRFSNWYKFHEPIEKSGGGIYISPFLTDIGKQLATEGEFFIEFSPNTFNYNPPLNK